MIRLFFRVYDAGILILIPPHLFVPRVNPPAAEDIYEYISPSAATTQVHISIERGAGAFENLLRNNHSCL